jgi:hypothetical protein
MDLGVGYPVGQNLIERSLHWNGCTWVPDRPGPSRIRRKPAMCFRNRPRRSSSYRSTAAT